MIKKPPPGPETIESPTVPPVETLAAKKASGPKGPSFGRAYYDVTDGVQKLSPKSAPV